jgi:hypothetical protein
MPRITTTAEARKDLPLATLAAITHDAGSEAGTILKALTGALRDTRDDIRYPLMEFVSQGLGTLPAAELWRKLVAVDLSFYKSPISEELRDEGRAESRAQDILFILGRRGVDVPDAVRERITSCDDSEVLLRWLDRALTVSSVEDIFTGDDI